MPAAPKHKAGREIVAALAVMQKGTLLTPAAPGHEADREIVAPLACKQEGILLTPAEPEHRRDGRALVQDPHASTCQQQEKKPLKMSRDDPTP